MQGNKKDEEQKKGETSATSEAKSESSDKPRTVEQAEENGETKTELNTDVPMTPLTPGLVGEVKSNEEVKSPSQ